MPKTPPRAPRPPFKHLNQRNLNLALRRLAADDPKLAAVLQTCGTPPLRSSPEGFTTLVNILLGQQISRLAARSLRVRLDTELGAPITPQATAACGLDGLRALGLSRQKATYLFELSLAIEAGTFSPEALNQLDDDAVIETLTRLKGFGRWSAENYLIFALGRTDVFPAADLGVMEGLRVCDRMRTRPTEAKLRARAAGWRPYRSAATLMLWYVRAHDLGELEEKAKGARI